MARIGAGFALSVVVCIRLLLDALVPGVQPMDTPTLLIVGAMVLSLFGVEVRDWWRAR